MAPVSLHGVAVVLAGAADHFSSLLVDRNALRTGREAAKRIDFARELASHVIHPLLPHFDVAVLAVCEAVEQSLVCHLHGFKLTPSGD